MDIIYRGYTVRQSVDKANASWYVFQTKGTKMEVRVHIAKTEDAAYTWIDKERRRALSFK